MITAGMSARMPLVKLPVKNTMRLMVVMKATITPIVPIMVEPLNTIRGRDVSHVATKNKMKDLKRGSVVRFKKTGYVVIYLGKSEGMYCFYSGEYGKCDFVADRFKWSKLEIISEAR